MHCQQWSQITSYSLSVIKFTRIFHILLLSFPFSFSVITLDLKDKQSHQHFVIDHSFFQVQHLHHQEPLTLYRIKREFLWRWQSCVAAILVNDKQLILCKIQILMQNTKFPRSTLTRRVCLFNPNCCWGEACLWSSHCEHNFVTSKARNIILSSWNYELKTILQ